MLFWGFGTNLLHASRFTFEYKSFNHLNELFAFTFECKSFNHMNELFAFTFKCKSFDHFNELFTFTFEYTSFNHLNELFNQTSTPPIILLMALVSAVGPTFEEKITAKKSLRYSVTMTMKTTMTMIP